MDFLELFANATQLLNYASRPVAFIISLIASVLLIGCALGGYKIYRVVQGLEVGILVFAFGYFVFALRSDSDPMGVSLFMAVIAILCAFLVYKYFDTIIGVIVYLKTLLILFLLLRFSTNMASVFIIAISALLAIIPAFLVVKFTQPILIIYTGLEFGSLAGSFLDILFNSPYDGFSKVSGLSIAVIGILFQISLYGFVKSNFEKVFDIEAAKKNLARIRDYDNSPADKSQSDDNTSQPTAADPLAGKTHYRFSERLVKFTRSKAYTLLCTFIILVNIILILIGYIYNGFHSYYTSSYHKNDFDLDEDSEYFYSNKDNNSGFLHHNGDEDFDSLNYDDDNSSGFLNHKDQDMEYYNDADTPDNSNLFNTERDDSQTSSKPESVSPDYLSEYFAGEQILGIFTAQNGNTTSTYVLLEPEYPDIEVQIYTGPEQAYSYCRVVNIDEDRNLTEFDKISLVEYDSSYDEYTTWFVGDYGLLHFKDGDHFYVNLYFEVGIQYKYTKVNNKFVQTDSLLVLEENPSTDIYTYWENDYVPITFEGGQYKQYYAYDISVQEMQKRFTNFDSICDECIAWLSGDGYAFDPYYGYDVNPSGSITDYYLTDVKHDATGTYYLDFTYTYDGYTYDCYFSAYEEGNTLKLHQTPFGNSVESYGHRQSITIPDLPVIK